jgi:hypothetical protein
MSFEKINKRKRSVGARIHCYGGQTTLKSFYLSQLGWKRVDVDIDSNLDIYLSEGDGFRVVEKPRRVARVLIDPLLRANDLPPEDVTGEYRAVPVKSEDGRVTTIKIPRHTRNITETTAKVRRRGTWVADAKEYDMWKEASTGSGLSMTLFIRSAVNTYIRDHHQEIWEGVWNNEGPLDF